ncbi:hypothetical protein E4O96_02830 [Pseudomonas fluorescens]|uniref:Uncharacterized protein n=1 Tax=Pseudomonas synxantha TaxID=47883 RepID=A0A5D3GDK8_9PSED|nr:hypothetical protein [Pseudomonas fluorescens]MCK3851944.1 hypothetical protein [Pseudomonas sp. W2Jun17]TYK58513.1 hypothetical protein FXO26_09885 [Pseudomonas synxantha]
MQRCNRVQPFCSGNFRRLIGKKLAFDKIRSALVRLLLRSAVLAPKRSKNTAFVLNHTWVQLIRKKLVAPYLLC